MALRAPRRTARRRLGQGLLRPPQLRRHPRRSPKTSTAPMAAALRLAVDSARSRSTPTAVLATSTMAGETKAGEYMTESAAKGAGNHADHGKACS